jgi:hypothetical protein
VFKEEFKLGQTGKEDEEVVLVKRQMRRSWRWWDGVCGCGK